MSTATRATVALLILTTVLISVQHSTQAAIVSDDIDNSISHPVNTLNRILSTAATKTPAIVKKTLATPEMLRETLERLSARQREDDHLMLENWLIDNINDLHRELKQTENDFEHYLHITKNMLATILAQLYPTNAVHRLEFLRRPPTTANTQQLSSPVNRDARVRLEDAPGVQGH